MAKKRRSVGVQLEEVDRTMHTTFCSAANSLSQLYSHAMNQQKLAFQAGERHSLEKIYEWIFRRQEEGLRMTTSDVVAYLQNELDYGGGEEDPSSPRLAFQHPQSQPNSGAQVSSGSLGPRSSTLDHHAKNPVFSSALSSPVRRSLQNYHLDQQGDNHLNNATTPRDLNSFSSNDSCMDMHADSPGRATPY